MKAGIAPELVRSQVVNTAAWLFPDPRAAGAAQALDAIDAAERDRVSRDGSHAYLRLLLAAHWATVATFVPTDVDARIRHHAWVAMETADEIARAADVVDDVARWDASAVSARVVRSAHGSLSGHDGEWLAVRAGALGRAIALDAEPVAERLASAIDAELDREETIAREALATDAPAETVLSIATIVAHNLGDLSRVVDAWPGAASFDALRRRYSRLGHADAPSANATFAAAGAINKALAAVENHRFLPLRRPRALRSSRALLLPIGPWFDGWGEVVARAPELEARDRAEVVSALLDVHASSPEQEGCLRALAGIHRATAGGLASLAHHLPASQRKDVGRGRVREAIDVAEARFRARVENRLAAVRRSR